jgi:23S rRNA (cytidine1920-2'-O)/16S rRNA (cytidine1409-2'-O)-methyltransferase
VKKARLDLILVERGLVESRTMAQRLVMAGQIRVDGQVASKPSINVDPNANIEIEQGPRFVSRGGEKLAAALLTFRIVIDGLICADVGASTGGFTDCLLQNGAVRVYSIDVGKGILHWKLRQDRRVVVMEETNARFIERLPEPVDLVTVDASFISLKTLLPTIRTWFSPGNDETTQSRETSKENSIIALVKPQFEAGRKQVSKGEGVIRDPAIHRQVLFDVLDFAQRQGFSVRGLIRSPLKGPKGNIEFLAWLSMPVGDNNFLDCETLEETIWKILNSA